MNDICSNYSLLVICTVLVRNNLTENAFGTRPERVPFAFHSRSICVPIVFHLRSAFTGTHLRNAFRLHSYRNRTSSEIVVISRVLISVTFTFCVYTTVSIDLQQVDHGGGRVRGRERATRATKSRWSTCVPCRNFNRIKNFGANNFDIKRVCTFHTITSPRRQLVYKNTKTFSRIDISLSSNETVCIECAWKRNN